MSEFTGGTTPTYFNPQNKEEPSELEIWLADGPDMDEIIARFAQLEAELDATVQLSEAKNDRLNQLEAANEELKQQVDYLQAAYLEGVIKEGTDG